MKKLLIFGISKYTDLVEHYFHTYTDYRVCGYTVHQSYITDETYNGKPVVPFEQVETYFPKDEVEVFIAVGVTKINEVRRDIFYAFEEKGYTFASFVHPKALVDPTVTMGRHCIIMENVVIQAFCKLGDNLIFFPGSAFTHHSDMGSHVFMASGVHVGGCSSIGDETFLGLGTVINDGTMVGKRCFISSGSVVNQHVPDETFIARSGEQQKLGKTMRMVLGRALSRGH